MTDHVKTYTKFIEIHLKQSKWSHNILQNIKTSILSTLISQLNVKSNKNTNWPIPESDTLNKHHMKE